MLHPKLTSLDGQTAWLAEIGPYGAWGDLAWSTRYGDGPCGMHEAAWSMPLPPGFEHPMLRRGTLVELMDGPWRVGSPLVLAEPDRGTGFDDPWRLTAMGIGSEVTGENSFYAFDSLGDTTAVPSVAAATAITHGWRIDGVDGSVPAVAVGANPPESLGTVGALLETAGASLGQRWGVGRDNLLHFYTDPTTPTYEVVPGAASLGVADDDYASVVYVRFLNSATGVNATAYAPASLSAASLRYGVREFARDVTGLGPISAAQAQAFADGIYANAKGRLGWTNGLTLTSQEILTSGGVPADLTRVAEDVGTGCMVRLHGIFDDLLETTGNTWLDIIIGEAKLVDGAQTIDLSPLGLAARDLAAVVEQVTGRAA